jgi:hypothetical protein
MFQHKRLLVRQVICAKIRVARLVLKMENQFVKPKNSQFSLFNAMSVNVPEAVC